MNGGNVASATNWARREDDWYDGNNISQFDSLQVHEAQQFGCIIGAALTVEGFVPMHVFDDAITVEGNP